MGLFDKLLGTKKKEKPDEQLQRQKEKERLS